MNISSLFDQHRNYALSTTCPAFRDHYTLAIVTYVPLAFTIITSFKTNEQFFTNIWLPELPLHPENYQRAWVVISRALKWNAIYSLPNMVLVVVVSGLAG